MQQEEYKDHNLAFYYLDIDHFKKFNDTYGHHVGDEVLKAFVRAAREVIRAQDSVFRPGGEEFWILQFLDPVQENQNQQYYLRKRAADLHQRMTKKSIKS